MKDHSITKWIAEFFYRKILELHEFQICPEWRGEPRHACIVTGGGSRTPADLAAFYQSYVGKSANFESSETTE